MDRFEILAIIVILFCIALPVGILAAYGRWIERRIRREEERRLRESPELCPGTIPYEARFDRPDFAALEAYIGRPLPASFKELFRQSDLVRKGQFVIVPPGSVAWTDWLPFGEFWPVDQLAIDEGQWKSLQTNEPYLPFAHDDDGNFYHLSIDSMTDDDAQVWFWEFHTSEPDLAAESLREMLSWPRLTLQQYDDAIG